MSDPCEPQAIGAQRVQIEAYLNDLLSRDAYTPRACKWRPAKIHLRHLNMRLCNMQHAAPQMQRGS